MSEYQYYEFQTVDRTLTQMEMKELRAISTRADITPAKFTNEYSFGDFKGDPDKLMEKYFDGFLYLANWGTHILQLRIPAKALSMKTARSYCLGDEATVRENSKNLIFTFTSEDEEGGDWIEGEGLLSSLLPLRTDLMNGDLRSLYIGWLGCAQAGRLDDDDLEPPVPPGLGKLSGPLSEFADFLRVDRKLIAIAAQSSQQMKAALPNHKEMSAWIASMPSAEKDKLLLQILEGDDLDVKLTLRTGFNRSRLAHNHVIEAPRRSVAALLGRSSKTGQ